MRSPFIVAIKAAVPSASDAEGKGPVSMWRRTSVTDLGSVMQVTVVRLGIDNGERAGINAVMYTSPHTASVR